ncbi:MAG: helix-turn-helix domain-containing protein [Nostoc sp. NMS7]|uniref:helix-turn-helix domain-containing protein n=1 Tax=Nostoc sp. TaxID=1180 RepID=UPI003FA5B31B|nr:helix-turn-helix domain-containing protein [Nostoc sp. NMS7]
MRERGSKLREASRREGIAKILGKHRSTVQRWLADFRAYGRRRGFTARSLNEETYRRPIRVA